MAFSLKDVRFTTRRTAGGDDAGESVEKTLHPRLVRDRSMLPKVAIAIQYFESMVGHERQELDTEVLVQFFGDHKLARCMVACLARSYRYRSPRFEDVVTRTALRRLQRAGLDSPKSLRFQLYDHLNGDANGFLRTMEREATYGTMEARYRLRQGDLERLLYLDADEHAVLARHCGAPQPEDVIAQYNFGVLETLLRHAERIELSLTPSAPLALEPASTVPTAESGQTAPSSAAPASAASLGERIRRLCAANDVDAHLSTEETEGLRLSIRGRQDALGVWARHGRKVARTVVQLLERARPAVVGGTAIVSLRDRRAILRLTPEVLDALGGAPAPCSGWEAIDGWSHADVLAAVATTRTTRATRGRRGPHGPHGLRGPQGGSAAGWRLRRLPDAQAWAAGVILPDLLLQTETQSALVCAVRSTAHGARLAAIAPSATTGEPYLFVGDPSAVAPLQAAGARAIASPTFDLHAIFDALHQPASPQLDLPEVAAKKPARSRRAA